MESQRTSSSQSPKLEKKLDEDDIGSGSTRSSRCNEAVDLEKGPDPAQQSPDENESVHDTAFLVKWEEHDPGNPKNWSSSYKAFITFVLGMLALAGSLGSSIISPAEQAISDEFHVSTEVTILMISLYVLGFALGPSCWAPISEVYGRKVSILPPVFILGLFSIGSAVSQSMASLLVTRFFSGVFGSAPISNVAAALGDIYEPKARGTAVTFYAVCVVGGPTIGPVIGAALTVSKGLGWRWSEYIEAIWVATVFGFALAFFPETYGPVLLKRKAVRTRRSTGDERYWHPHESEKIKLDNIVKKYLSRPLKMLITEPMVTAIAMYASFVYGLLYMTLEMFPIVYQQERHWGLVVSSTTFLGLFIGVLAAMAINLANQPHYARAVERNKGRAVPEARLPPMIIGSWLFVIGLFWFGWTASPQYHWAIPTVATVFIGAGFNVIFQQCINFLVDTYAIYAASAVSANTILRSIMACGLPLAARPLFQNLGVGPGASVLGGIAAAALPVPWIFMKYGLKLRKMSKFAPVVED